MTMKFEVHGPILVDTRQATWKYGLSSMFAILATVAAFTALIMVVQRRWTWSNNQGVTVALLNSYKRLANSSEAVSPTPETLA